MKTGWEICPANDVTSKNWETLPNCTKLMAEIVKYYSDPEVSYLLYIRRLNSHNAPRVVAHAYAWVTRWLADDWLVLCDVSPAVMYCMSFRNSKDKTKAPKTAYILKRNIWKQIVNFIKQKMWFRKLEIYFPIAQTFWLK